MFGKKNTDRVFSERTCKSCGKVFMGTGKEKKCERCRSIDAGRLRNVGVVAVAVTGIVAKLLYDKFSGNGKNE